MKKIAGWLVAAMVAVAPAAAAGPVTVDLTLVSPFDGTFLMSLDPAGGILSGNPGDVVGWGFSLTTDASHGILVTSTDFCTSGPPFPSPCTNTYTDLMGFTNSIFLDAGQPTMSQSFDGLGNGFGSLVVPSQNVSGLLVFNYSLTDINGDPIDGSDGTVSVVAEVDVAAVATPEPAVGGVCCLALAVLLLRGRHPA